MLTILYESHRRKNAESVEYLREELDRSEKIIEQWRNHVEELTQIYND